MKESFRKFFRSIDIFPQNPKIRINNNSDFKRSTGGFISLIFILLLTTKFFLIVDQILKRSKNFRISQRETFNQTVNLSTLKYNKDFSLMISVLDNSFVPQDSSNFNYLNFTFTDNSIEMNNQGKSNRKKMESVLNLINSNNNLETLFKNEYKILFRDCVYIMNQTLGAIKIGGNLLINNETHSPGFTVKPLDNFINNPSNFQFLFQNQVGGIILFFNYIDYDLSSFPFTKSNKSVPIFLNIDNVNRSHTINLNLKNFEFIQDTLFIPGDITSDSLTILDSYDHLISDNPFFKIDINLVLGNRKITTVVFGNNYFYYLSEFIITVMFLYFISKNFVTFLFANIYVSYLINKFIRVNKKEKYDPKNNSIKNRKSLSIFENLMKQKKHKFEYETLDIELKNINFVSDVIDSGDNSVENSNDSHLYELEEMKKTKPNQIMINIKEEPMSEDRLREEPKTSYQVQNLPRKKIFQTQIIYEIHQQQYKIDPLSYFEYFLLLNSKLKNQILGNYYIIKFCSCQKKNRMSYQIIEYYSKYLNDYLSYESILHSLLEHEKFKKIFFNNNQNDIFSNFYGNYYLTHKEDLRVTEIDEMKKLETLTNLTSNEFEDWKNRRLLEQMNLELDSCYSFKEKE